MLTGNTLYIRLRDEKGKEEALSWFRDGEGYKINVEAWMPYFTLRKSFVVFSAWIENRYWGHNVVIEELSDESSSLLFKDHEYLILYDVTGHIKPQILFDEYKELFEDQWIDRAKQVGWNVDFVYDKFDTRLRFSE